MYVVGLDVFSLLPFQLQRFEALMVHLSTNILIKSIQIQCNSMEHPDRPTVVDLFCGAGGLSEGFKQAGFKILLGVDNDPVAAETYRKNHGKCIGDKSIEEVTAETIYEKAGTRNITVLAAGPPCQAFSTVAVAKLRKLGRSTTIRNPLNRLYKEFLRLVKEIEPPFFVMENVGRMLSIHDGRIKKEIESELEGKYEVTFYYENVADFGVPQIRKRGIVIGNRLKVKNPVLVRTHFNPEEEALEGMIPYETVRSAISDLPKIKAGGGKKKMKYHGKNLAGYQRDRRDGADGFVYDHIARTHSKEDLRIFKLLKQGQWIKDLPKRYNRYRKDIFLDKYKKQSWNRPSSTILAHLSKDGLMFIHPDATQNRSFTPREAARLQSFDDKFVFEGPRTKQYIQIGNAVPPLFSRAIASAIKEILDTNLQLAIAVQQPSLSMRNHRR